MTEALKITLLLSLILGTLSIFAGQEMIGLLGTESAVAESGGLYLAFGRWDNRPLGLDD